jgi:hypothetical protein
MSTSECASVGVPEDGDFHLNLEVFAKQLVGLKYGLPLTSSPSPPALDSREDEGGGSLNEGKLGNREREVVQWLREEM